jgi:hypothetical protein
MACCSGRVPGIAAPKETVLLPGRSRPKPLTLPDNGPLRPRSWHFHGVACSRGEWSALPSPAWPRKASLVAISPEIERARHGYGRRQQTTTQAHWWRGRCLIQEGCCVSRPWQGLSYCRDVPRGWPVRRQIQTRWEEASKRIRHLRTAARSIGSDVGTVLEFEITQSKSGTGDCRRIGTRIARIRSDRRTVLTCLNNDPHGQAATALIQRCGDPTHARS